MAKGSSPTNSSAETFELGLGNIGQTHQAVDGLQRFEQVVLAVVPQAVVQRRNGGKMMPDRVLAVAHDHSRLRDAGRRGFFKHVLNDGLVDHGHEFLRDRLGERQEPGAEAGCGDHSFPDGFHI